MAKKYEDYIMFMYAIVHYPKKEKPVIIQEFKGIMAKDEKQVLIEISRSLDKKYDLDEIKFIITAFQPGE